MEFIKEESEDMKIEETFSLKHEDTEEQTKMVYIKEESEDMKIEETFSLKHEDTEEQTKMVFIKEESEDMKIEEAFRVKHEDTEEQTGWLLFSKLNYFVLFLYIFCPLAAFSLNCFLDFLS